MSTTFTPTGREVSESSLSERVMKIREVKDFRLEQTSRNTYRIQVLPEKNSDIRGLKGSVLDALVDIYGMKAVYDIDIILEDEELLPETIERARNHCRKDTLSPNSE